MKSSKTFLAMKQLFKFVLEALADSGKWASPLILARAMIPEEKHAPTDFLGKDGAYDLFVEAVDANISNSVWLEVCRELLKKLRGIAMRFGRANKHRLSSMRRDNKLTFSTLTESTPQENSIWRVAVTAYAETPAHPAGP